jgi:fatty-acyl-CoA synthase
MVIGDYLGRRAIYSPAKEAIVDYSKQPVWRLTYAQLNERANRLANWLRTTAAVQPGDRVAILARDGVEHLDTFFACGKLGAIHTALNWRLHWRETAAILAETTPRVLIYDEEFQDVTLHLQESALSDLPHFLHLGGQGVPGSRLFASALQSSSDDPVSTETVTAETTAALVFTGGTTGHPKGAQISHRMIAWNSLNTVIHDLHHDDIYLNVFPLFHTGGLFVYTVPQIILGGATILMRQFDPAQVLTLLEQEEVTIFAGVPSMYQMLTQAENWPQANLSSLRFCTSGGAPLPPTLVQQYAAEKGVRFKQGFGMSEFGPGLFALAPEDALRKAGSIGRPNFFVDARVVNDQNQPVGPHTVGELVLKGPSACSGYFNNAEAMAAALDDQGWFHTGDLATYDEDWYFTIVDRKKDMFISGGENVYPVEIEKALYGHTAVQMCAVIGVADARWGEVGMAYVVLKPGATATGAELLNHLQANLAAFKVPKQLKIVDSLPLSAAGKILKRKLRVQSE